jgi:hypothetical protein
MQVIAIDIIVDPLAVSPVIVSMGRGASYAFHLFFLL